MKAHYKGNHAVRIRKNGQGRRGFVATHVCNIEEGLDSATVLGAKLFMTLNGADKYALKLLEKE